MNVSLGTDVTNTLTLDLSTSDGGTAPAAAAGPTSPAALRTEVPAAPGAAALADHLNIQPLDLAGALRILVAEVRADLAEIPIGLTGLRAGDGGPRAGDGGPPAATNPLPGPQMLVQLFLQALPDMSLPPPAWLAAVTHLEAALELALDKAVAAVAAWQGVAPMVVEGAAATRAAVLGALVEEPLAPVWLQPEWLGLVPRAQWFWRRRRLARRGLSDPDLLPPEWPREGAERSARDADPWHGNIGRDPPEER